MTNGVVGEVKNDKSFTFYKNERMQETKKIEVGVYRSQNLMPKMCFISDLVHIIDSLRFLSFFLSFTVSLCVRLDPNRIF